MTQATLIVQGSVLRHGALRRCKGLHISTAALLIACEATKTNDGGSDAATSEEVDASNQCNALAYFYSMLGASTVGPLGGEIYDGEAIVERSTASELLLNFETPSVADAGAPIRRHVRIAGADPMPAFPIGSKVWLSKDPAGNPQYDSFYQSPPGWAFSVRDRANGTLLLGAAFNSESPAAPVIARKGAEICVSPNPVCPQNDDAHLYYYEVEVLSDSPVTIAQGNTKVITLDGNDYDVQAVARRETPGSEFCAHDYRTDVNGTVSVAVQAQNLAALIDGLEPGDPPLCAQGNDPPLEISFTLYGVSVGTTYEGPAVYLHRDAEPSAYPDKDGFVFDLPNLADQGSGKPLLVAYAPPGIFREPEANAELWLSVPNLSTHALRESQNGALLLASSYVLSTPFDAPTETTLTQALGFTVRSEWSCGYATGNDGETIPLWDLVFATTPQARAKSGQVTEVTVGEHRYAVWLWSAGSLSFSIHAL